MDGNRDGKHSDHDRGLFSVSFSLWGQWLGDCNILRHWSTVIGPWGTAFDWQCRSHQCCPMPTNGARVKSITSLISIQVECLLDILYQCWDAMWMKSYFSSLPLLHTLSWLWLQIEHKMGVIFGSHLCRVWHRRRTFARYEAWLISNNEWHVSLWVLLDLAYICTFICLFKVDCCCFFLYCLYPQETHTLFWKVTLMAGDLFFIQLCCDGNLCLYILYDSFIKLLWL